MNSHLKLMAQKIGIEESGSGGRLGKRVELRMQAAFYLFLLLIYDSIEPILAEELQSCLDKCNDNATFQAIVCAYNSTVEASSFLVGSTKEASVCAWLKCGLAVAYPGRCGCPNNCFSDQSHGSCWNGTCRCNGNWGGADCSFLDCPNDICELHGRCVPRNGTSAPHCICNRGWTGYYCSTPVGYLDPYPFGMYHFEGNSKDAYFHDQFHDQHPLFNRSQVGTLFLDVDEQAYRKMILPENIYHSPFVRANATLINGQFYGKASGPVPCEMSVYGQTSRTSIKKSFYVQFSHTVFGVDSFFLKAPYEYSLQTQFLTYDLLRAVSIPIQRAGWVRLYVNNVSFGLYVIQETHDYEWLKTYFTNPRGSLLKGSYAADLVYKGEDINIYKNAHFTDYDSLISIPIYEPVIGNFNWSKLVTLMKILDVRVTTDEEFIGQIEEIFNVDGYFRVLVIDIFTTNFNSYSCQSNLFFLYDNPQTGKFDFIGDGYNRWNYGDPSIPAPVGGWESVDPYMWCNFTVFPGEKPPPSPLSTRLLGCPKLRTQFERIFRIFLDDVYKSIGNRLTTVTTMLSQEQEYDRFTKVALPSYEAYAWVRTSEIQKFLDARATELKVMIPLYLSDQLMWLILVPVGVVMIGPIVTVIRCLALRGADEKPGEGQKLLQWVPK